MMGKIIILLIALTLDLIFSDPPNTRHPVAWRGKLISWEEKLAPHAGEFRQAAYGASIVLVTFGLISTAVYFLLAQLNEFNLIVYVTTSGLLLKFRFSWRGLTKGIGVMNHAC